MSFFKVLRAGLGLIILASGAQSALGQWTTQTITLNAGWNAVFLELQPAKDDCDILFAGIPVESVWAWNRRYSSVQFIRDANQLVPGQPDWLTYFPSDSPARSTRNLFALQGAHPYLIKLKAGSPVTFWTVTGQPAVRQIDWLADSLNFVGFNLAPGSAPSFQSFFAGSAAHAGQQAYRLDATGRWQLVSSPTTTFLKAGEAYWVFCKGDSTFSGPVDLTLENRDGLIYQSLLTEQTLRIKNSSTAASTISVQPLTSATPPGTNFPVLAGPVPLSYYRVDATNNVFGWFPLSAPLQRANLQPGEEWVLRLEVNRDQMAPFVPPPGTNTGLYQSVLLISNNVGSRYLLSVSSEGLTRYASSQPGPGPVDSGTTIDSRAGLWVGNATIDKVSQPANLTTPTTPLPVGSPLQFRLLMHVDDNGKVRLLQKVLQMFKPGTLKPDPDNLSNNIVDVPGRYVLVTDDKLIPQFTGATLRDGQAVGRRLSSAAFGFSQPILFAANGAFGSGSFACQVVAGYNDPLSPFKHLYHPDHDNLDEQYRPLPEGIESFTVIRQIQLSFSSQDPEHLTIAGWGDNQVGGVYKETISGLHNQPIYLSGNFRLTRACSIGVLNDGL